MLKLNDITYRSSDILGIINKSLQILEMEWQDSQGLLLSEDDFKHHLLRIMYQNKVFLEKTVTRDLDIKGSPIHSEINFFDENQELKIKPDISILNPENLSIAHSLQKFVFKNGRLIYANTTGKSFEFTGEAIVIELAFIKKNNGITHKRDIEKIREDFNKINQLIRINGNSIKGFIAVFSKSNNYSKEFGDLKSEIANNSSIQFYWGSSNYKNDESRNMPSFERNLSHDLFHN